MGVTSSDSRALLNEYTLQYWKNANANDVSDLEAAQEEISRLRKLVRMVDPEKLKSVCVVEDEPAVVDQDSSRDESYNDILLTTLRYKLEERFSSLHESFLALDLDRTGFINKAEFKDACFRWGVMLHHGDFEYLHNMFKGEGDDTSRGIDYGQFISLITKEVDCDVGLDGHNGRLARLLRSRVMDGHATMRQAFREADVTRTGDLSRAEVQALLGKFHLDCSEAEFDEFFADYDRTHDQRFCYGEFVHLMQKPAVVEEQAFHEYLESTGNGIEEVLGSLKVRKDRTGRASMSTVAESSKSSKLAVQVYDKEYGQRLLDAIRDRMETRFGSLHVTFRQLDSDHSGYVSRHDFEKACSAWGLMLDEGDYRLIHSMFPHPDSDGVNYAEFVALMTGKDPRPVLKDGEGDNNGRVAQILRSRLMDGHRTMRQAFKLADVSGTGTLTKQEVLDLVKTYHIDCSHSEFDRFFSNYDRNGDGTFTYGEFVQLLQLPDSDYD